MRDKPFKLDPKQVKEAFEYDRDENPRWQIGTLQVVIYVAVGGGMIGRMYAEQPADAYIDTRVGKCPYTRKQIENMRQCLIAMAEVHGLNPHSMPRMPDFHNCGVF